MFETLFAVGAIGFWVLLAVEVILLICWIEHEEPGWATFSVLVTLGILQLGGLPIYQTIAANPLSVLVCVGGYVFAGVAWATLRWYLFCKKQLRWYENYKTEWLDGEDVKPGDPMPEYLRQEFLNDVKNEARYNDIQLMPEVGDNKGRIYLWLAYWPWSCLWTMIDDPVRRIFEEVYASVSKTFQRISDRVWGDARKDLEQKK